MLQSLIFFKITKLNLSTLKHKHKITDNFKLYSMNKEKKMRVCIFMKVPFFGTSLSVTMETVALFEKLNKVYY